VIVTVPALTAVTAGPPAATGVDGTTTMTRSTVRTTHSNKPTSHRPGTSYTSVPGATALSPASAPTTSSTIRESAGGSTAQSHPVPSSPTSSVGARTPATTIASTSAPSSTSAGAVVRVDLSGCGACRVVATRANVVGGLGAALVSTSAGALLLSVHADGSRAGVINVPYGSTFPSPTAGRLACDVAGRCVLVARQPDGNAILSAFALSSDGGWRDVSGSGGFQSGTGVGLPVDVNGDGVLDIAVQETAGAAVGWVVFAWAGSGFEIDGCAPATSQTPPTARALSMDSCLS
jgi:hypothetical protein